jgi:hypothetical protein
LAGSPLPEAGKGALAVEQHLVAGIQDLLWKISFVKKNAMLDRER